MAKRLVQALAVAPWAMMTGLWSRRELIGEFTRRNIELRHRGSRLGALWALINPLTMLALYFVIFGVIYHTRFGAIEGETAWQYGLGLMIFHGPVGHTGTLENALSADVTLPNDYSLMISTTSEEPGDGEGLLEENGRALTALMRLADLVP